MAGSSHSIINETQATNLQNAFAAYVDGHTNLSDAFVSSTEGPMYGYQMTLTQYQELLRYVGIVTWKVRFGHDSTAAEGRKFVLIITGYAADNSQATPHFLLTNPLDKALTNPSQIRMGSPNHRIHIVNDIVPVILSNNWIPAWNNLMADESVPNDFFKPMTGQLRGYNFKSGDFLGILYETQAFDTVVFAFANHALLAQDPSDQPSEPGTFGIAVAGVKNASGTPESVSAFYDMSAPCPPTC